MSSHDPIHRCERSLWLRWPLSSLYQRRVRSGRWYVPLDGSVAQLAHEAVRHAPPTFRRLRRSVPAAEVDEHAGHRPEWQAARKQLRPGDRIWPFLINPWTSATRAGYVVVRRGEALCVIVTTVS